MRGTASTMAWWALAGCLLTLLPGGAGAGLAAVPAAPAADPTPRVPGRRAQLPQNEQALVQLQ